MASDLLTTYRKALGDLTLGLEALVTSKSTDPAWRSEINAFCTEHGFSSSRKRYRIIAGQAALLALLKLVYARLVTHTTPPAESTLAQALSWAWDSAALADPETSVLDRLLAAAELPCTFDVSTLASSLHQEATAGTIDDLYLDIVPQAERRELGQFWTPTSIARFMADWSITRSDVRVLEPASGTGRMVFAITRRLLELGAPKNGLGNQVFTNEISALLRQLMLTVVEAAYGGTWPHVDLSDFLVARNAKQQRFDAIVCNPPYTRHHHIPAATKASLRAKLQSDLGVDVSGFSSLFLYFYLHALTLLSEDGRMAFITPAELFDASYSKTLKVHLLSKVNLRAVIYFEGETLAFEGVDTSGVISLTEGGPCDGKVIRFVALREWPGEATLLTALEGPIGEYPWGHVEERSRESLVGKKWVRSSKIPTVSQQGTIALSEIAQVMRGVATGCNDFFTLTEEERVSHNLSTTYLVPVLCKTRDATSLVLSAKDFTNLRTQGRKSWMFVCHKSPEQLAGTPEASYIAQGVSKGLDKGSLVSKRKHWFHNERRAIPLFVYTYMSRGNPRFILNEADAQTLNAFLHVLPKAGVITSDSVRDALAGILNSRFVLEQLPSVGRSYGGGTVKVEPRELDSLRLPDIRTLTPTLLEELAAHFHQVVVAQNHSNEKAHAQALEDLDLRVRQLASGQ